MKDYQEAKNNSNYICCSYKNKMIHIECYRVKCSVCANERYVHIINKNFKLTEAGPRWGM